MNVSTGKQNYSQRNNVIKPLENCNVTSMVMALIIWAINFTNGNVNSRRIT
jgi:hypothetical protein